jgi:hypothetical protein
MRVATTAGAFLLDALLLAAFSAILFVAVTGGGAFYFGTARVSLTTTGNPLLLAGFVACARYAWFNAVRFLWAPRYTPADFDRLASGFAASVSGQAQPTRFPPGIVLGALLLGSIFLRLLNAWAAPGFVTGDDVEIHEMTLGMLLGYDWPIWELRSALYPMTVIYPAQALAYRFAGPDIEALVLAGRLVVVALATLSIWLVYVITRRLGATEGVALLAASLLATSRLHLWFGSSELPRPVASVLLLTAFWLLLGDGRLRVGLAGVLLGLGAALRFGEAVFFFPAIVGLLMQRRILDSVLLVGLGGAAALSAIGVADWLYWGRPGASLVAIIDYTLVQRESSRGFQPLWYYVASINAWANVPYLVLGVLALGLTERRAALWAWLPILLLSLLPHKEARYAIPVLPFLCVAVAHAFQHLARKRLSRPALALLVFALLVAVLFEVTNWRVRRTDDAVAIARHLAVLQPDGVAAEQLWRLGGRLYLRDITPVLEVQGAPTADLELPEAVGCGPATTVSGKRPSAPGDTRKRLNSVRAAM